jgi:hypothetical protein
MTTVRNLPKKFGNWGTTFNLLRIDIYETDIKISIRPSAIKQSISIRWT